MGDVEKVARIIFDAMRWAAMQPHGGNVPPEWVEHGNSHAQDRARDAARAAHSAEVAKVLEPFAEAGQEVDEWCRRMALKHGGTADDAEQFVPSADTCFVFGHNGTTRVKYADLRAAAALRRRVTGG